MVSTFIVLVNRDLGLELDAELGQDDRMETCITIRGRVYSRHDPDRATEDSPRLCEVDRG